MSAMNTYIILILAYYNTISPIRDEINFQRYKDTTRYLLYLYLHVKL